MLEIATNIFHFWKSHTAASPWNESLIYSASFTTIVFTVMLLGMQNRHWRSPLIPVLAWTISGCAVIELTELVCGNINDLMLPGFLTLLFGIACRVLVDRFTAFGFGAALAMMYTGCCISLYMGQFVQYYFFTKESLLSSAIIHSVQATTIITSAIKIMTTGFIDIPLGICLRSPKRDDAEKVMRSMRGAYSPLVSIHVPCYSEPPELVTKTLNALDKLQYRNFEVLVIDNNTKDLALWKPVEAHCKKLGGQFRFFHIDPLPGAKAGAVNFALEQTNPAAEIICLVDADYIVETDFLDRYLPLFTDPQTGYVQLSHDYYNRKDSRFSDAVYHMYVNFHKVALPNICEQDAGYTVGTMCLLRRHVLEEAGGWAEWCLTEDSEVAVRIHALGYTGHALADTGGRGLIPETFDGMKKQWFRWTAGPVQQLLHHWRLYSGLERSQLTLRQKFNEMRHSFAYLPRFIQFFFSLIAIPSAVIFLLMLNDGALPPITSGVAIYLLSTNIMVWINRWVYFNYLDIYQEKPTNSFSGIKGLTTFAYNRLIISALHWTYVTAMVAPFLKGRLTWRRTDKFDKSFSLLRALSAARTETLLALVHFVIGSFLFSFANFKPIDYTAIAAIMTFMCGVGFMSSLCVSLYFEIILANKEMPTSPSLRQT